MLYKNQDDSEPDLKSVRQVYDLCPSFRAMIIAMLVQQWERCFRRVEKGGPSYRAGRNDTIMATYLPYCSVFVCDDKRQRNLLKQVVLYAKLSDCEVLSPSDLYDRLNAKDGNAESLTMPEPIPIKNLKSEDGAHELATSPANQIETTTAPHTILEALVDVDVANFGTARSILGEDFDLVEDFRRAYGILANLVVPPPDKGQQQVLLTIVGLSAVACRELVFGMASLLRAHRADSWMHLRRAIEASAVAAKISKHPHMAKIWMDARLGKSQYEKFRNTFTKLFPDDDPLLVKLGDRYGHCSRSMHASVYGTVSHVTIGSKKEMNISLTDLPPDHSLVSSFYAALFMHVLMLKLFAQSLRAFISKDGRKVWKARIKELETRLQSFHDKWETAVPKP